MTTTINKITMVAVPIAVAAVGIFAIRFKDIIKTKTYQQKLDKGGEDDRRKLKVREADRNILKPNARKEWLNSLYNKNNTDYTLNEYQKRLEEDKALVFFRPNRFNPLKMWRPGQKRPGPYNPWRPGVDNKTMPMARCKSMNHFKDPFGEDWTILEFPNTDINIPTANVIIRNQELILDPALW